MLMAFLLLCSLSTISAANQTINSTNTGGIAQGITDTGTGETLFLQPGTYNKTNQDTNITINKNITIQGNGPADKIIIDARRLSRIFTIPDNLNVTFINITFTNANFAGNGGAIYDNFGATMTFINCIFTNNNATTGGAIFQYRGGNLTVTDCNFFNNNANTAGAIYHNGVSDTITNIIVSGSNFTNNSALYNGSGAGSGGAIVIRNSTGIIINSNFINNSAQTGSSISFTDNNNGKGNISISNSNFTGNNDFRYGGTVYSAYSNSTLTNCNFINNTGQYGGGIHNTDGSNMTVIECNFINNTAAVNGGAIHNTVGASGLSSNIVIIGSNFFDNTASDFGGAINNRDALVILYNNTMSGNSADLGQMIYNNATTMGTISMGVLNLTFIDNSTWIVKNGSTITLFVTLTDDMGNTVTGLNISFYLDGVFFENVTAIEGYANITYTPSSTGDIPVSGEYEGNGAYDILINNGLLQVRIPTNIIISVPKEVKVGDTVTLESKMIDDDGNPIAGATVDFYVDGVKVGSGITDSNGVAKLNYTFTKAGKPNVVAKYEGNDTYLASNATNSTTVSKIPADLIITVPEEVKVNETVTLESKLTDDDGNPIANATVDFYVDGVKVGSGVTDSNGVAKLNYIFTKSGKPKITVKYAGNDTYLASTANGQTTVSKTSTKMTIKKKDNKITVTLTDEDGNPLEGKEIVLKDSKGRVLGIGITNKDGQVTFIISDNGITVTATFTEDDTFLGSTASLSIKSDAPTTDNTDNDNSVSANMKNTGMPIVAIVLVLLSMIGVMYRKR